MLTPLYDDNPHTYVTRPYVTYAIILINVLVFALLQEGLKGGVVNQATVALGLIPNQLYGVLPHGDFALFHTVFHVPENVTLLSYMFLHGSWMHLIGNMLFLWVLGDNIEDATGHWGFIVFYLLCGVAAGLFQSMLIPGLDNPVIGASGAVAGVIAAYLILHPNVFVWALAFQSIPVRLKAFWVLGIWVVFQVVSILLNKGGHVAWGTHIGGLIAGAVLILLMRRKGVKLFQ